MAETVTQHLHNSDILLGALYTRFGVLPFTAYAARRSLTVDALEGYAGDLLTENWDRDLIILGRTLGALVSSPPPSCYAIFKHQPERRAPALWQVVCGDYLGAENIP